MASHLVKTDRPSESCSFGVPRMALDGDSDQLIRSSQQQAAKQGLGRTARSTAAKNVTSFDRLSEYASVSRPGAAAAPVERTGRSPAHVSDARSRLCPIMAPQTKRATRGGDDGE
jgi:hypothetical protein